MPKFTSEEVRALMDKPERVRNVCLVGAMATGKTSIMDCLGAVSGMLSDDKIGDARFTHCRQDEREKGCTLKSNVTSLITGVAPDTHLLSMMDTPGHAEYSAELSIALPLCDGALMVVDGSGGGLAAQTNRHLKDLTAWQVRPVVFCNRIDVSILVLDKKSQEIYDDLSMVVDALNTQIQALEVPEGGKSFKVTPEDGSIIFGSASNGWAFTLPQVAQIYAAKFGVEVEKMASRLWGEMYFNAKAKKWTSAGGEAGSVRAFNQFVMDPILKVKDVCIAGDFTKLEKMLGALGVTLTTEDKKNTGKLLFRRVMQLWMCAGNCLSAAFVKHVPNPVQAAKLRVKVLTLGSATDPNTELVAKCDPKAGILIACTKLAPQPATPGRFYCIGRVFSGTVGADKMYLLPDDHVPEYAKVVEDAPMPDAAKAEEVEEGADASPVARKAMAKPAKSSLEERRLQGAFVCCAKAFNSVPNVPAGNIAAFSGIDQFILKRNTLSASKDAFPLRPPSFNVSAVVRVSVAPKEPKDLPKTVEGLRRLAKSCPLVEVQLEEGGDHVVGACGGEHIRVLRRDLETDYLPGIKLEWSAPSVQYKETVTAESSMMCLSKSPNKHNRLFMKAEPLDEEVCRAIETKRITPMQDAKIRGKILCNEFGWEKMDTLKIWGFGPAAESADKPVGANILVDQCKGVQYLNEIKESVNSGLLWASKQGPIAEESMRGCRFNLLDVKLHTDSIHRGMGQMQPTARRVFFCSMITADMRLVEPIFLASIEAPAEASAGIMQALGCCRGELVMSDDSGDQLSVTAYVPISETIGSMPFATVLGQKTSGKAFVSYAFDHWENMTSDPLSAGSKSYELMLDIRRRKGLKVEPPVLADYYDKL